MVVSIKKNAHSKHNVRGLCPVLRSVYCVNAYYMIADARVVKM